MTMTERFKILAKYIKDMSSETPDVETYISAGNNMSKYQLDIDIKSMALKNKMIEIINEKIDTYSTLALYYLLDNNLINDQVKVGELFDKVISINKDIELKNLVIFKKGLYFSDKLEEGELLKILNPIINSESIWKQHALLLMGDYYFYKKQFNKSKEFFSKIIELKNVNSKIKTEVEKRLNRDFSE